MAKKAKPAEPAPPVEALSWEQRPADDLVADAVKEFFAAVTRGDAGRAFALCPHKLYSKPYFQVADKESTKKAVALMRKVLLDHELITKEDKNWAERLAVTTVEPVAQASYYGRLTLDGRAIPHAGLFTLVMDGPRWKLTFDMLRSTP